MSSTIRNFVSGIGFRVGASFLTMGALMGAAIVVAYVIFGHFNVLIHTVTKSDIPDLRASSEVIQSANQLPRGFSEILLARDLDELEAAKTESTTLFDTFFGIIADRPPREAIALANRLSDLTLDMLTLAAQREDNILASQKLAEEVAQLDKINPEVTRRASATLRASYEEFVTALSRIAQAKTAQQLEELQAIASRLEAPALAALTNEGLAEFVPPLRALGDPQTGLAKWRRTVLETEAMAAERSRTSLGKIAALGSEATQMVDAALNNLSERSEALQSEMTDATTQMNVAVTLAAAAVILAILYMHWSIVRPLGNLTKRTRVLAEGDTDALDGLRKRGGEIGAMTEALQIFRSNIVENRRLAEEKRAAELAEAKAREEAEHRKLEAEREEMERKAREEREALDRERAEQAERDARRAQAEAERAAREAEQELVVSSLAGSLKKLAQGNLNARLMTAFPAAYEGLRTDFNATIDALSELVSQIQQSSQNILTNSSEVSNAAADLAHRTENTAATLEETAAAVEELAATSTSAAENSRSTERKVTSARDEAISSRQVMSQAVDAMTRISSSSDRITRIISVIDDIAFQTNLLALNAGVEAARAGEAGRGFAVVASEVRGLAQRSSEAAREINELISESGENVRIGVDLVGRTGNVLENIVRTIGEISENISSVAKSVEEQTHAVREINTATTQLDQLTQQNAAMFEETSAASTSLSQEAKQLFQAITKFTLEEDASASAGSQAA